MPYNILLSNGDALIAGGLLDNTADTANTSLALVGKNYKGYGLFLNQNFARLLENFANTTAPANPLPGQIWFNSTTKRLNVNISATKGTLDANWKNVAGLTISATTPSTQFTGELWYDSANGQLNIYTGTGWRLIGPLSKLSTGNTGAIPDTVTDAPPTTTYIILRFILNNVTVGIWSNNPDFNSDVPGFEVIRRGINLNSTIVQKVYGTTTLAESILVGATPTFGNSFLRNDQSGSTVGALSILNDTGLSIGAASDFVANVNVGTVTLRNQTNNRDLIFSLRSGGIQTPFLRGNNVTGLAEVYNNPTAVSPALTVATKNYVDILSGSINGTANFFGDITPSANLTYTLGNTTNRFTNIFSQSILVGNVNAANTFATTSNVAQIYIGADITPTANISSNLGSFARRFDTLHSNTASLTGNLSVGVSATVGSNVTIGDSVSVGGKIDISGNALISQNVTATGNVTVGGKVDISANLNVVGNIIASAATVSVSPTTGALVLSGGVGVAGNLNVGGNVQVSGRLIALTMPVGTANTHVATTAFVNNAVGTLGTMALQNSSSVSITGGAISLTTPLGIASGGTGLVSVGTAGTVLTSNGSAASWQAPSTSQMLGVGQTWQNVSSSRSSGVTYTNSTGKPIQVSILGLITLNVSFADWFEVGGTVVTRVGGSGNAANMPAYVYAIVPPGTTYRLNSIFGVGVNYWAELR